MQWNDRIRVALFLIGCAAMLGPLAAFWYSLGNPVRLPDAASPSHKLQCVSYTPFDKDQSPFDVPFQLRPHRMDADLALLAQRFRCIRTYSMTGLEQIPALARKHGLKVMLGAWVNANPRDTQKEINALIASANANADVVTSVIVGNEVLLRKEATGAQLARLVRQVKAQVEQPVTYADVWEFWLKHPEMAPAVDFITIHLLPYWEDEPTGIDDAVARVAQVHRTFMSRYAPKEIVIGETGWPSEGRQRETALPSRANEAKFIRTFVALAEQEGWHYNLIEAFDQPWKRENEGAVGGYWGMYDADRTDKGILEGPVSNLPRWREALAASGLAYMLALVLAGVPERRRDALTLPLMAATGAAALGMWLVLTAVTARTLTDWLWAFALAGLDLIVLAYAVLGLGRRTAWRARLFEALRVRSGKWLMASGFVAAVLMLGMVFDPRYRSFPTAALWVPALVFALRPAAIPANEGRLLTLIVALGIAPQMVMEGPGNPQAWGWAAVSAMMAVALWRGVRAGRSAAAVNAAPPLAPPAPPQTSQG